MLSGWLRPPQRWKALGRRGRLGVVAGTMAALLVVGAGGALAEERGLGEPGPQRDGRTLLVNQRTITPAGAQTVLGDLPVNAVLSPDGAHLLVVNSGAGIQSLQVVATRTGQVVQTLQYFVPDSVFVGATYSPDGRQAFVAGGGFAVVHTFSVAGDGQLTKGADIQDRHPEAEPLPNGRGRQP
jgi:hypothetical protein